MVMGAHYKVWVPFKYENLPILYFGCGKMGHGAKDCEFLTDEKKHKSVEDFPYSVALKAESSMIGKECFHFGRLRKKYV